MSIQFKFFIVFSCLLYASIHGLFSVNTTIDSTKTNHIDLINNNLDIIKNNITAETDSFLYLAKETLELSEAINYHTGISWSYFYVADILKYRNNNDSAIAYYKKGLQAVNNDDDLKASFYWNLANLNRITGNYSIALEYSLNAKELVESGKTSYFKYKIYNLLALSYQTLMEYDLAKTYYEKTAQMAAEEGDTAFTGIIYANIGKLLFDQEKYDEALEYFEKGTKIEKQFHLDGSLGNSYIIISNIYLQKNMLDSARIYLLKAVDIHRKLNNKPGITHALLGISNYYYRSQDYDNALMHLNLTLNYAKDYNFKSVLSEAYQLRAKVYANQGKYEKAFSDFEHFFEIYNELYDVKKINKAKALEQQLIQREKENALVELDLKRQKTVNILLVVIVSLVVVVVIIVFNSLLSIKKLNKELIISKEKAEESDKLKSKFLQTISHEIRTPLNGIIGFSEMLAKNDDIQQSELDQINEMVLKNSEDLTSTIENLVDIAHLSTNQYNVKKNNFEIKKVLNKLIDNLKSSSIYKNKKHIQLIFKPENEIEVFSDKLIISKVIIHLLKNALLFTEKGSIELGYNLIENNKIVIYVKDTGIGISKEKIDVIFSAFRNADDNINIKVGGTGLGLSIVSKFIELLNGSIWVESEINKGSTFNISLPVK